MIVCFESSEVVDDLVEEHWIYIQNFRVEAKPYLADSKQYMGRMKIQDDQNLDQIERGNQVSRMKTIKVNEKR